MAQELYAFQVTIPAGTPVSSPVVTNVTLPVRSLSALEVIVPPGPMGFMGFAVTMGGVHVLPINAGTYIVTDDEVIHWPVSDLPTSGAWQVTGYNTDVFDHTVYLRFLVDLIPTPRALSAVGSASTSSLSNP